MTRRSTSISENIEDQHTELERVWLSRYHTLKENGYILRKRYRPGWVPSWKVDSKLHDIECEDWIPINHARLLDAQRISDGLSVMIKEVPSDGSEALIACFLSSESLKDDCRNHSIPVLDAFLDPLDETKTLLIFPLLSRVVQTPFAVVSEVLEFVHQTLEGLVFLHEHEVAHRDCALGNIMMDGRALYPVPWHPQSPSIDLQNRRIVGVKTRSEIGGVQYFFTDFGLSTKGLAETVGRAGMERAPELSSKVPYDPYKLDVYVLGKVYKEIFLDTFANVDFLGPLIAQTTMLDPQERPTAAESLALFEQIRSTLKNPSQRLKTEDEGTITRVVAETRTWFHWQWTRLRTKPVLDPFRL